MALSRDPIWYKDARLPHYPALSGEHEADACIVGGGITGITAAYLLATAGYRVILLEKKELCAGATGATTAFLSSIIDTDMKDLVATYGTRFAKRVIDSHARAIDTIEKIVRDEAIECDFSRCDNFLYARDDSQERALAEEFKAARTLGYKARALALPFSHSGAFAIARQGKFHPLKYLAALANIAEERGASLYEESPAIEIERDSTDSIVRTKKGSVRAPLVLLATYEPFTKPISLYFKKAFYTSYMYAGTLKAGAIPEGIYEDLSNPYTYFRIDRGKKNDSFVIGGEDHRSDVRVSHEKNFKALRDELERIFGSIPHEITHKWYGPILEPIDGLPYIGRFGESGYVAMGFSGNGMTYGTIAAMMFYDRVRGKKNPWEALYEPSRIGGLKRLLVKGRDYTGELIGGALRNAALYRR